VALLLAAIVEAGSALGFMLVARATTSNPPPLAPSNAPGPAKAQRRHANPPRPTEPHGLERWAQTRLKTHPAAEIPAREAYADFCRYLRSAGLEPCTETRFGRDFTACIRELGGSKVKRRDRSYYVGVSLAEPLNYKGTSQPQRGTPRRGEAARNSRWKRDFVTSL
jgi:hypothetical protein